MQIKRKHLGVAVMDDILYAVGGRDEKFELSSVERYKQKESKAVLKCMVTISFSDMMQG